MRTITGSLFISLDGVVEAPNTWHFDWFDDEMGEIVQAGMDAADAVLLGRRTYQEWAGFWPGAEGPMADYINGTTKYVVSRTLERTEWSNSTLVSLADLKSVKESAGRGISVVGSATLVRSLLDAGLLDELSLLVHPVVVGSGARLFPDGSPTHRFTTAASRTLSTGVMHVVYRPVA
jgi:dihydrofolate reductase